MTNATAVGHATAWRSSARSRAGAGGWREFAPNLVEFSSATANDRAGPGIPGAARQWCCRSRWSDRRRSSARPSSRSSPSARVPSSRSRSRCPRRRGRPCRAPADRRGPRRGPRRPGLRRRAREGHVDEPRRQRSATTADDGTFFLREIEAGEYRAIATRDGVGWSERTTSPTRVCW